MQTFFSGKNLFYSRCLDIVFALLSPFFGTIVFPNPKNHTNIWKKMYFKNFVAHFVPCNSFFVVYRSMFELRTFVLFESTGRFRTFLLVIRFYFCLS